MGNTDIVCGVRKLTSPRPPASSPYRFFVFDLDGTLVDSRKDLADSANELLAELGRAPLREEQIGRMVGDGASVLVARVCAASGIDQPPDALARFLAIYDTRLLHHTRPYDGVVEVLDTLRARVPTAVLTNKPLASTKRVLDGLQLAPFFAESMVIGGDGPFPRKPDPEGLLHLARAAAVRVESVVMVGDSDIDLRTARAAGTHVCLARYGFGFETVNTQELATTERVIATPRDLLRL